MGLEDLFLIRYDAEGNVMWTRRTNQFNAAQDVGMGVAALPNGASIVTGRVSNRYFLAVYDVTGDQVWVRTTPVLVSNGVAGFSDGTSVVVGRMSAGSAGQLIGNGEPNETRLFAAGDYDVFLARYHADGTLAWARLDGGEGFDVALAVAGLPDGSSVVVGTFTGTATFGRGTAGEVTLASQGATDAFLARYGADGNLAWVRRITGLGNDATAGVSAFPDGSFVVTGRFFQTATFGEGESGATALTVAGVASHADVFVARYRGDGTLVWARRAGSTGQDRGFGIAALPDGSSIATGQFQGSATFGPGESGEVTLLSANGTNDVFVAAYTETGELAWARRAGSAAASSLYDEAGYAVGALADGSVLVTGEIHSNAVFGQGESTETVFANPGCFIARFVGGVPSTRIRAPAAIVQECDDPEGDGSTVHFVFDVVPGTADLLRVTDLTGSRTLLEVSNPSAQQYGIGPVVFPHGASTVSIRLLAGATEVASATVTVQIEDTVAPVLTGCEAKTIELQGPLTALDPQLLGIGAADACDPVPAVGLAPASLALGTTTVTATARDATGNSSSCDFAVTVVDTTPPGFLVQPQDIERHCEGAETVVAFDVLAEDLSGSVTIECRDETNRAIDPSGTPFAVGEHIVTCTATDGSGNGASWAFRVTIVDDEAPVIVVPADIVVGTDPGVSYAFVAFAVTATDECDPAATISCAAPWGPVESGDAFPLGSTTVTCTARDHAGNEASVSFSITVQDREPPVIAAPASVTLTTDCAGSALAVTAATLGATATDNCDPEVALVVAPGSVEPGTTGVVVTATDEDGNASQMTVQVTVLRGPFDVRFLRPLDGNVDNVIHAGRTVPVKIRVSCENVFEAGATAVIERVERLDASGTPVANEVVDDPGCGDDEDDSMRLRPCAELYVYQLKTRGWPTTSGTRFRVVVRVSKPGHVDTFASVVLRNR